MRQSIFVGLRSDKSPKTSTASCQNNLQGVSYLSAITTPSGDIE